MAWYELHHSCGHTGRVNLIGPHKQRNWRIERMEADICDECKERARAEENARAAAENKKLGLPELKGTEKQVAWAETIRKNILEEIEKQMAEMVEKGKTPTQEQLADFNAALDVVMGKQSASWWIDHRDTYIQNILSECLKEAKTRNAPALATTENQVAAMAEATIRPENPRTETIAEFSVASGTFYVDFPEKRESFRTCMHEHDLKWNGSRWYRTPGPLAGKFEDRVAQTAAALLDLRYVVRIYDGEIRKKALDRSFEKEQRCWVKLRKDKNCFAIRWPKNVDCWAAAKRLPGARWDGERYEMLVPAEQYEQVLDFAEVHGFGVTEKARALADEAALIKDAALIAPPAPDVPEEPDSLAIPEEGFTVDPALLDKEEE